MNIERYLKKPFGSLSKPKKYLAKKHLAWIRKQQCVVSGVEGDTIDAHHVQRKAQGVNDYLAVPLDHVLHNQLHSQGVEYFQGFHRVDLKDALIAKLVERIIDLESKVGK